MESITINVNNLDAVYEDIKSIVICSRNKVYSVVNTEMLNLYWNVGKRIM